jgi:nicotinate-nucleotide pyrophosphorylase (carboxylating)
MLTNTKRLPDYLSADLLEADIRRWLAEDVGDGDVTTAATVAEGTAATGSFRVKQDGVVAGLEVAERVFATIDAAVETKFVVCDGAVVTKGDLLGTISGPAHVILRGERLALNLMQRMSGISTATSRMAAAARPFGTRILDTRKTAPGLRALDKWAVSLGGGYNHRFGLYDMILVKDNHIAACGGISEAIQRAVDFRATNNPALEIEVEVRTLDEVRAALRHEGVDRLLLDNMVSVVDGVIDTAMLREAVALVDRRIPTEASGNITDLTVAAVAASGVDFISSGALTHSVAALDISLAITVG